jgi:hypothetical protein
MMRAQLIGLALAALPALAHAAPDPVTVGAWHVTQVSDTACQAVTGFGDHIMVSISEDGTGSGNFVFTDDRWVLKDGDAKPGTISWDGWKTSRPIEFTVVKGTEHWLLVAPTEAYFTENLAESKHFWLRVPGVDFDEDFDVPDAMDVINAISACSAKL